MPKSGLKLSFLSFFQVWSLVFLEIGYDDSLDHCLSTPRVKAPERIFFGGEGGKLGLKLGFLPFSQGCIISFP